MKRPWDPTTTKIPPELLLSPSYLEEIRPPPRTLVTLLFRQIKHSVTDINQSYFAVIEGHHRAGKSLFAVGMAMLLDPTFYDDFQNRLVYTPVQFMKAIDKMRERDEHSRVILWDEAGVGLNNLDWYEAVSKSIVKAIQVMGWLNPIILFVTQRRRLLNSSAKSFVKNLWILRRNNAQFTLVKPYLYKYDELFERDITQSPIINIDLRQYVLKSFKFYRIPKKIEKKYLEISTMWKEEIITSMKNMVTSSEFGTLTDEPVKSLQQVIEEITTDIKSYTLTSGANIKLNKDTIIANYPYLKDKQINYLVHYLQPLLHDFSEKNFLQKKDKILNSIKFNPDKYYKKNGALNTNYIKKLYSISEEQAFEIERILMEQKETEDDEL